MPYVRGLQGEGTWRQTTATCKHSYTYDMEGSWPDAQGKLVNRGTFDANVSSPLQPRSRRLLSRAVQSMLGHRKGREFHVFVPRYGAVNGVPTCADQKMNEMFKRWSNGGDDVGEAFLMSDW